MKVTVVHFTALTILILGSLCQPVYADLDDFDTTNSVVELREFMSGGPSKDGIPSLDKPKFVAAGEAHFLKNDDKIVGVVIDGQAKAYPIRILNWHEIVNDKIADRSVAANPPR